MNWTDLTSPQIASVSRDAICVLPLGATEQHGQHLPVGTDQMIANELARRLDEAADNQLLILPELPATCSQHHMSFPGTLTLSHETFIEVVVQIVKSAAQHGFTRFFLLNAHGGNIAAGGVIVERLSVEVPQAHSVFGTWFRMASKELRPLVEGDYPSVGHACEFETSVIMATTPALVDDAQIADAGNFPISPLLQSDLLDPAAISSAVSFEKLTASGVWGKPSFASAEKGHAILEQVVRKIMSYLHALWPAAPGVEPSATREEFCSE